MNTTSKADLINILMAGRQTPSDIPDADIKTCMLIDGHALIQSIVHINWNTTLENTYTRRVDVALDHYIGVRFSFF